MMRKVSSILLPRTAAMREVSPEEVARMTAPAFCSREYFKSAKKSLSFLRPFIPKGTNQSPLCQSRQTKGKANLSASRIRTPSGCLSTRSAGRSKTSTLNRTSAKEYSPASRIRMPSGSFFPADFGETTKNSGDFSPLIDSIRRPRLQDS